MSNVVIDENTLTSIGDSIRNKLDVETTYKPSQMADAINNIETPNLQSLNITENGNYSPPAGKNGFLNVTANVPNSYVAGDEGKVVQNGALVAQTSATKTANGTYDTTTNNEVIVNVQPPLQSKTATENGTVTPDSGYYGLDQVTVNVSGGGGGGSSALLQIAEKELVNTGLFDIEVVGVIPQNDIPNGILRFLVWTNYYSANYFFDGINLYHMDADEFVQSITPVNIPFNGSAEYGSYVYGRTELIQRTRMVLLGQFVGGQPTGNRTLSDDIENYDGVVLQGVYYNQLTSQYNTTMIYNADINVNRWTGMKDRNKTYDCYVRFNGGNSVTLSGGSSTRGVLIYGLPKD